MNVLDAVVEKEYRITELQTDDEEMNSCYNNICRVKHTKPGMLYPANIIVTGE